MLPVGVPSSSSGASLPFGSAVGVASSGRVLSEGMKDSTTFGIGESQLIVIGLILVSALSATVAIIFLGDWVMRRKWIFADGAWLPA
jgi:hypothetical protein